MRYVSRAKPLQRPQAMGCIPAFSRDGRIGQETRDYNNVVALHRKCATCHIPASQVTRFPASWGNYLCQRPRVLWYANPHAIIGEFASWTLGVYIDRNVPLPANRKRLFEDAASTSTDATNPDNATLQMRNGKVQKLYDYLSWQIREHDYSTRRLGGRRTVSWNDRKLLPCSNPPTLRYPSRESLHNG